MAAPMLPFAPSAVAPVAMHTRHDLRRVIAAYEQRIFTLEIELAKNEASAVYATDAMRAHRMIHVTIKSAKSKEEQL